MDDSTQKNPPSEDSVSMYLSFADDTMMSTNTIYNTIESVKDSSLDEAMEDIMPEANKTLEAGDNKLIIKVEQLSPLRSFDNNIFNKFNAMSSTPSKDIMITAKPIVPAYENQPDFDYQSAIDNIEVNKENTHPDLCGDASSLSSTVDGTSSKTLMMSTTDDDSVQETKAIKNKAQLKTTTNKDVKQTDSKVPLTLKSPNILKQTKHENETKEDIKELIDKMLKLTEKFEKKKSSNILNSVPSFATKSRGSLMPSVAAAKARGSLMPSVAAAKARGSFMPSVAAAKARGSLLPTAAGDKRGLAIKQRMSVVVKTTLNSPARKMASKIGTQRRSVLPVKSATIGSYSRQSLIPTVKPTSSITVGKCEPSSAKSAAATITKYKPNSSPSYSCTNCGTSFRIKSLLDAHKRSHEEDGGLPTFVKKTLGSSANASATNNHLSNANQCKYCDKKFAIERALHIHLLQNCTKIPPSDKRKLQFTELNHVVKAQLPIFPHGSTETTHMAPVVATPSTPVPKPSPQIFTEPLKTKMLPPSSLKKPRQKSTPHAGIFRTPTKSVPCHICKQSFKSILDYTNHSLTVHSTNAKNKLIKNEAQSANNLTKM